MQQTSRQDTHARVDRELAQAGATHSEWTAPQKLAMACRMLAADDHWRSGLAGQISARASDPGATVDTRAGARPGTAAGTPADTHADSYWTLRFGVGADEACASDLMRIDADLNPADGEGMPNPATRFHLWVYRRRPDVQCIVHTHPPAVSALAMLEERLAVAHMDATPFFEDCAYLDEWPGVPLADEEGEMISAALGDKRSILLANHGLLTAGRTIEEAVVLAVWMEQAADLQLRARAVGPLKPIRPERARDAHDFLAKPEIVGLTFAYFARRVLRRAPEVLG